jgi:hypothetical protein
MGMTSLKTSNRGTSIAAMTMRECRIVVRFFITDRDSER